MKNKRILGYLRLADSTVFIETWDKPEIYIGASDSITYQSVLIPLSDIHVLCNNGLMKPIYSNFSTI